MTIKDQTDDGSDEDTPRGGRLRGPDGRMRRSITTAKRDAEAARLRARGWSYQDIADKLEMANHSVAAKAVKRAMDAILTPAAEELRKRMLLQLDEITRILDTIMRRNHLTVSNGKVVFLYRDDGDPIPVVDDGPAMQAAMALVRVQESVRKMLGLDAATKISVTEPVKHVIEGVPLEELK